MTAHNEAKKEEIAKTVIMPGDPLRAKFIAEHYLEKATLVNQVRGMLAYTGYYHGTKLTVMGSGMGMPSIGIYAYELFHDYEVQSIIRIGSCGAYQENLQLFDVLLVKEAYSESTYAQVQSNNLANELKPSATLNESIKETAKQLELPLIEGKIHSSDVFYGGEEAKKMAIAKGCLATEMESFALFQTAQLLNKQAACILTVSNSLVTQEETTSEERETAFRTMIELALETGSHIQ